ncbi:MAG: FHA domain-containing protein [Bdellovibrionales bacterium]|nr:FHA domain-containing protein [Bdellovibrionales bacterium]
MSLPKDIDHIVLVISRRSGGQPESAVILPRGQSIQVGRSSRNDISIDNPAVSRAHLTLTWQGDKIIARDLGSLNGTLLNRHKLKADTGVQIGDVLKVSDTRITLHSPDSSVAKEAISISGAKTSGTADNATISGSVSVQDRLKTAPARREHEGGFGPESSANLSKKAVTRIVLVVAGCAFLLGAAFVILANGGN